MEWVMDLVDWPYPNILDYVHAEMADSLVGKENPDLIVIYSKENNLQIIKNRNLGRYFLKIFNEYYFSNLTYEWINKLREAESKIYTSQERGWWCFSNWNKFFQRILWNKYFG